MIEIKVLASGSDGNAYFVSDGDTPLLIEAGIRFTELRKRLSFDVNRLIGVLISHDHADHSKAIKDIMKAGIDCFMSKGTAEALKVNGHRVHRIEAQKPFQIDQL